VDTEYPFDDVAKIIINSEIDFNLHFRVPQWSENFQLEVNGKKIKINLDQ
jgi:DUF1680 family protein